MDMNQKHEPQPWDMYRLRCDIVVMVVKPDQYMLQEFAGYVPVLDSDGEPNGVTIGSIESGEYIGNVLALPTLVEALRECKTDMHAEAFAQGGDLLEAIRMLRLRLTTISKTVSSALRAAGLPAPQNQEDHR